MDDTELRAYIQQQNQLLTLIVQRLDSLNKLFAEEEELEREHEAAEEQRHQDDGGSKISEQ